MKYPFLFALFILILSTQILLSQPSGHPSSVQWQKIESTYFNIIYPQGRYNEAKRIGNIVTLMNENTTYKNNHKNRKIDIILQTRQVIANGYVGIGPYRSEYYSTPLQNSFLSTNTDWMDVLSIHEYKHVHQLNDTRVGLTKLASYVLGQGGWAGLKFLAMPDWYAEGDAIHGETSLTSGGRGRTPQFLAPQKALLLDGKKFRYSQMRGGSFRFDLPNHYVFGHILHNYVERNHGPDTWEKVIDRAARYKHGPFYNFSISLKKETGSKVRSIYKKAFEEYFQKIGGNQVTERSSVLPSNKITKNIKTPTFYEYPFLIGNDVFALKSSFKKTPYISVISQDKKEKKLTSIGINSEKYLGYRDSLFTWCEYERDPRWAFENFSNIYYYDLSSGRKSQITTKGKYFSPDPNKSLQSIVAVKMDTSLQSKMVFINMNNGQLKKEVSAIDNGFISYPKWVTNDEVIYISRQNKEATLYHYNISKDLHHALTPSTTHMINQPSIDGRKVVFTATFDGTDQIYSVDINTKNIQKLTNETVGAYAPFLKDDTLIYQTIISRGEDLRISKLAGEPFDIKERADRNQDINIVNDIKDTDYEPKSYKRTGRMQLHSYAPSQDLNRPGIQLYFENALANISGTGEVYYNVNEKAFQTNASVSFSSKYPVFTLNLAPTARSSFALVPDSNKLKLYTFDEMNYGVSTSVPLTWVDGNMSRSLRPSFGINYKHIYNKQLLFTPKDLSSFTNMSLGLSFSNLRRFAPQNFGTRWGQEISANFRSSLYGPKGQAFQVRGNIYLPGILQNHRIKIGAEYYNEQFLNTYKFSNNFQYVRGGSVTPYNAARRISFDYGLPLFYPEIGILDISYFKRVRLNIFGDMSQVDLANDRTFDAQSVGTELYFDNVWLNAFPLTFGARLSYVVEGEERKWRPELIFALDF